MKLFKRRKKNSSNNNFELSTREQFLWETLEENYNLKKENLKLKKKLEELDGRRNKSIKRRK